LRSGSSAAGKLLQQQVSGSVDASLQELTSFKIQVNGLWRNVKALTPNASSISKMNASKLQRMKLQNAILWLHQIKYLGLDVTKPSVTT